MPNEDAVKDNEQSEQDEEVTVNVTSIEDVGTLKKRVTVEVPRGLIDQRLDENFGKLSRTAQVPGFRIGRAPLQLIEKRFGKDVHEQVRLGLIGDGVEQAIKQSDLKTLGEPDFKPDEIKLPEKEPMSFSFEVEVEPEFELPELEGIKVTEHDIEITDKDVDEHIENVRWRLAVLEDQRDDAKAEKADQVTADVTLEVADQPPTVRRDLDIAVRPQRVEGIVFEGLEQALVGAAVGETCRTEATVGDEHDNEAWRGKSAKLIVAIKKIAKWHLPELNDELAKKVGYESLSLWREATKTDLDARKGQQVREDMEGQIRRSLLDNTALELPAGLIKRQTERALMRRVLQLREMGTPPVLIEERIDDLRTRAHEQTVDDLKFSFIAARIARMHEIEVPEEEINSTIASIAIRQGRRPERMREEMVRDGNIAAVTELIQERKVLAKLLGDAKIVKDKRRQADPDSQADAAAKTS